MSWIRVLLGLAVLGWGSNAHAVSYSVNLNEVYSGAAPAGQNTPWLRATFEDIPGGKVRLTMEALNLTAREFVGSWYFNLNPAIAPSGLVFVLDPLDPGLAVPNAINHNPTGQNYKAGPEKYFDIQFANETANNPNRFSAGETLIYDIGLAGGSLQASDFLFRNQQKIGSSLSDDDWYSAAHVQAIGIAGQSGWIGAKTYYVNEPGIGGSTAVNDDGRTALLLAVASAALIGLGRSQRREQRV